MLGIKDHSRFQHSNILDDYKGFKYPLDVQKIQKKILSNKGIQIYQKIINKDIKTKQKKRTPNIEVHWVLNFKYWALDHAKGLQTWSSRSGFGVIRWWLRGTSKSTPSFSCFSHWASTATFSKLPPKMRSDQFLWSEEPSFLTAQ